MKIGVLKETEPGEKRVAAVPETIMKYTGMGLDVVVENNAGSEAGFCDDDYLKAGAVLTADRHEIYTKADILLRIKSVPEAEYGNLRPGQILVADLETGRFPERIGAFAAAGISALALEKMPRISKAQSMDILSSQNNIAGYKAALLAMDRLNRGIPLMITSAGTIPPAKALVLGAGVAGLQAIATLKRMGAVVYASDVRAAAREQVESLGGRFLVVDDEADFETSGGYAGQVSPEYLLKQKEKISEQLRQTDILITTALSGGKTVPVLVTAEMMSLLPSGAVAVDMAGGNIENNNLREDIVLIQDNNLATRVPHSASRLFSRNLLSLIETYGGGEFKLDLNDEIISAVCVCIDGRLREV